MSKFTKSSWMTYYFWWYSEVRIQRAVYYPKRPGERSCEWQWRGRRSHDNMTNVVHSYYTEHTVWLFKHKNMYFFQNKNPIRVYVILDAALLEPVYSKKWKCYLLTLNMYNFSFSYKQKRTVMYMVKLQKDK